MNNGEQVTNERAQLAYFLGQLDSGLKVGDWVRVTRMPVSEDEGGWYVVSDPGLKERFVGKIGKIVGDLRMAGFDIHFSDEEDEISWSFPYFVLEKVEPPIPPIDFRLMGTCTMSSQKAIWLNADNHGWHNPPCDLPTDLLLIPSEVSEACEALREGNMQVVEEELADVIIRVLHIAEKNGFDMARAVRDKHYKNVHRPYRHGNKMF